MSRAREIAITACRTFSGHFISKNRNDIKTHISRTYRIYRARRVQQRQRTTDRSGKRTETGSFNNLPITTTITTTTICDLVLDFLSQGKFPVSRGLHSSIDKASRGGSSHKNPARNQMIPRRSKSVSSLDLSQFVHFVLAPFQQR